jgi:hypothetical protein
VLAQDALMSTVATRARHNDLFMAILLDTRYWVSIVHSETLGALLKTKLLRINEANVSHQVSPYHLHIVVRMVAIATALPLLTLRGWPDPLRHTLVTQIFPHSVVALFILVLVVWSVLFSWLHIRSAAARRSYIFCGLALGVFPAAVYFAVCQLTSQVGPPIALAFAGVVAGLLAGIVLLRESKARQFA